MDNQQLFNLMFIGSYNVLFTDHEHGSLIDRIGELKADEGICRAIWDHVAPGPDSPFHISPEPKHITEFKEWLGLKD